MAKFISRGNYVEVQDIRQVISMERKRSIKGRGAAIKSNFVAGTVAEFGKVETIWRDGVGMILNTKDAKVELQLGDIVAGGSKHTDTETNVTTHFAWAYPVVDKLA